MSREKKTNEATRDRRFFVSSLCFDPIHIARRMLRAIKTHWSTGNRPHWVLNVAFIQDRTQCLNADFLAGKTVINKVALDLIAKLSDMEEMETGKKAASAPGWKSRLNTPAKAMELLAKLYEATPQG